MSNDHFGEINDRLERMETKIDTVIESVAKTRERTARIETKAAIFGAIGGFFATLVKSRVWP